MMGKPSVRAAAALIAGSVLLPFEGPIPEPQPSGGEDHAIARLVSMRVRLRPVRGGEPGSCLDLGPDELEVRLRGRRLEEGSLVELERERPATVHALLIDTSGSMLGHLDYVREAAARYVERLDLARDTGLVATFDDDVILGQAVVADRDRLLAAVRAVKMGSNTAMLDALSFVLGELTTRQGRRVVLLLTDGVDTASLNERHDVFAQIEGVHDLRVFTIGLALPPLGVIGPPGINSTRSFLQRLAERTQGEFFEAPRPGRLESVYDRISELVESEATLNVVDPEPESAAAKLTVRSRRPGCRVEVLGPRYVTAEPAARVEPPWSRLPRRLPLAFSDAYRAHLNRAHHEVAPECGGTDPELAADLERLASEAWFAGAERDGIRGCALDVRLDTGLLYDPTFLTWTALNGWIELETRSFAVTLPPFTALPTHPANALDGLAEHALRIAGVEVRTDPLKRPAEEHARPHVDYPALVSGRTFLEIRGGLARLAFLEPSYRDWSLGRLRAEADEALTTLRERYRRRFPGVEAEVLEEAVLQSEEAQGILREASRPSVEGLERHLAAWLGDIGAHELFAAWEARHVERLISGAEQLELRERWTELRSVFRAPSYNRVLALLAPVHDVERGQVGYYRVVLPRVSWFQPRLPGFSRHPEWGELPLDLVPNFPFAYLALEEALASDAALRARLARGRWRAEPPRYELTDKPGRHTPVRAYGRAHVTQLLWQSDLAGCGLEIAADVGLDRAGEPLDAELRWRPLGNGCER